MACAICDKVARQMRLNLLTLLGLLVCSPISAWFQPIPGHPRLPSASCDGSREAYHVGSTRYLSSILSQTFGGWATHDGDAVLRNANANAAIPGRRQASQLRMSSSAAPPVKPPKKRGWGGGGRGDDLYVRELLEPEKSEILTSWRDFAKRDGRERFAESVQILNEMHAFPRVETQRSYVCNKIDIAWRSGVIAQRKRRFTLACCKGTAVQAVACVQIGPKNDNVRSFLAQDACMSLCLLIVDPEAPMFKAGAHLCKEIKEIGRSENMAVDFQPIKDIYAGRFYAATLTM